MGIRDRFMDDEAKKVTEEIDRITNTQVETGGEGNIDRGQAERGLGRASRQLVEQGVGVERDVAGAQFVAPTHAHAQGANAERGVAGVRGEHSGGVSAGFERREALYGGGPNQIMSKKHEQGWEGSQIGSAEQPVSMRMAERELRQDEQELVDSARFVGEESKRQVEERLEEDREDYEREVGVETGAIKLTGNQERLTRDAVGRIETAIARDADNPGKLEKQWFQATTNFLRDNYGRILGERN